MQPFRGWQQTDEPGKGETARTARRLCLKQKNKMKTIQTDDQIKSLVQIVEAAGGRLFCHESGDPKYNAQHNLVGRTHYVDTDTLRWHKSRVLSTAILAGGLLFRITESCALDMHNTRRGKRCVVFDVFGTVVSRPDLEGTFSTSDAARNASNREEIDLAAHYREALASRLHWAEQDAAKAKAALSATDAEHSQKLEVVA